MTRVRSVALVCALGAVTLPAFAGSSASASLSNVQFKLIDLTPTDSSVSSFSLANVPLSFGYYFSAAAQTKSEVAYDDGGLFTHTQVHSGSLDTVSGTASMGLNGLSVEGEAAGPESSFGVILQNRYGYESVIKLAAQSMLIITADAVVSASATNPSACFCSSEYANSLVTMNLQYQVPTQAGGISGNSNNTLMTSVFANQQYSYESFEGYDYSLADWYDHPIYRTVEAPFLEQAQVVSRQFSAVFVNNTDGELTAQLSVHAQAHGVATTAMGYVAPSVPEPTTWALTFAGLGMLGFFARRRAC